MMSSNVHDTPLQVLFKYDLNKVYFLYLEIAIDMIRIQLAGV